ncbi:MAG: HK97 gp10 family phage protein [Rhodoferax sp.]|nr:HK97 gp10 family phage protein [Rhodoferax sp.]
MKIEMKLAGVDGVMEMLRKMPAEVVSKRGGPVKTALRKGAKVIHDQAKQNLQISVANTNDEGKRLSTGLLLKNLVITRGKAPTVGKGERYLVRVRRKTYGRAGKPVTTLASAQLLEYGSEKQNAEPWLRPAFQAKAEQAILTVEKSLVLEIERIAKKLASQNRN